jgi:uncharacterized protein (TIGR03437 family)
MTRAFLLFLTVLPAAGQFTGLATNDSGSQLYFSSTFQLAGSTGENTYEKIFLYDGANFRLVAQRSPADSDYYHLEAPYVSGNGSVTGYQALGDCGIACDHTLPAVTTVFYSGSLSPSTLSYPCQLSKNAQYALCGNGPQPFAQVRLISMATGASTPFNSGCLGAANMVASNGTALQYPLFTSGPIPIVLQSASGSRQTTLNSGFCPMISDDGSTIVSSTMSLNVQSGKLTTFYTPDIFGSALASISNDGALVLEIFGASSQLAIIHTDGSGSKQLTFDLSGVQRAVLSGDGSIAYAVTGDGKLLKIATVTGTITQLVGTTPLITSYGFPSAPGTQIRLEGTGLSATKEIATAPVTTLGGVQVLLNGQPATLIQVAPMLITFQIPWEMPVGNFTVKLATTSQFVQPSPAMSMQAIFPVVITGPYHQDFSGTVDAQHPAHAGEIIQYYFGGLGPVTPPVPDGVASPASPLSIPVSPMAPIIAAGQEPFQIYYQGLAPGLIGIYQVAIQLPAKVSGSIPFPGINYVDLNLKLQYAGAQTLSLFSIPVIPN